MLLMKIDDFNHAKLLGLVSKVFNPMISTLELIELANLWDGSVLSLMSWID